MRPGERLTLTPTRVLLQADGKPVDERGAPNDYRTTNKLFNRLQDVRVDGTPLLDLVAYDGVSMWQFLPSYVWPEVFRAVELAEIVAGLVRESGSAAFAAEPAADSAAAIWAGVVREAGIDLVHAGGPAPQRRRTLRSVAGGVRRRLRRLRRPRPAEWPQTAGGGLLLATLGARHWVPRPGGDGYYDEQFSPLLPALRSAGWDQIRLIDCQELPPTAFRNRPLDGAAWYVPGLRQGTTDPAVQQHFAGIWDTLRRSPELREGLSHRGISLLPALEPTLSHAFRTTLPECVGYLAGASSVLDAVRPDAVVVTYESGPHQRALLIEAARRSIPTVGLMHGMIYDTHYDYMHANVTTDPFGRPAGFAIPQVTCVWGDYWRDVLVERGHYPRGAVAVTGNARVEEFLELARRTSAGDMRSALGIEPSRRVVLVLTAGERIGVFLDAIFAALDGQRDCVPLVKPHPGDDVTFIEERLEAHGHDRDRIHHGNLAEAILAADLVISQISTASLEAMLLRRPLVLVNLGRVPGFSEASVESGLARYAETSAAVSREVQLALSDDQFELRTEGSHREFVQRWFGGADSHAAERIAGVVTDLTRPS